MRVPLLSVKYILHLAKETSDGSLVHHEYRTNTSPQFLLVRSFPQRKPLLKHQQTRNLTLAGILSVYSFFFNESESNIKS